MKNSFLLILAIIFGSAAIMAQSSQKGKYLKPENFHKAVNTLVSGKSRNYYSLSDQKPSIINVQGPGKLKVITRGRFKPGEGEKINYTVLYSVDGQEQKNIPVSSVKRSKNATYVKGSLGIPAENKDFEIDLERGSHTIGFKLKDSLIRVAVRYKFTPAKEKKQEWIAFSPMSPSEPVDIVSGETSVNYHRFSNDKPLKVEVIGPTTLRVLTRIENHYQMKGIIHYRVQVKEGNKVLNTYQLSSRHSEVAVYKDHKDLIPGKACEFVINVPKGKHVYEILPLDQDKSTILGRLLLPKKDVKLMNE